MAMTLIEGVGDEVTLFFVVALLVAVACLAWWTTRVAERPLRIQTIIVGQRVIHVDERGRPAVAAATAAETTEPGDPPPQPEPDPAPEMEPSCDEEENSGLEVAVREAADATDGERGQAPAASDGPRPEPAPDDRQQLRLRRLAFMERQTAAEPTDGGQTDVSNRSGEQVTATEGPEAHLWRGAAASDRSQPADSPREDEEASQSEERTSAEPDGEEEAGSAAAAGSQSITVKLKFLNDTQRTVEGSRAEALADFKRRHFPAETAANRLVRLIFNGRLLPDQATLDQCGLYHNCVVHCHVSAEPRPRAEPAAAAAGAGAAPAELDIGILLYPALTSVVTLVWGLRMRYPELFSGVAVVLLGAITLLFACFAAASFLPLERLTGARPARQQQRGR